MNELLLLVLLKIAYLATGLILCLIGKTIIEKKLETKFEGEGSIAKTSFKIITKSPGLVFLIAGLVVIGFTILQRSEIKDAYRKETVVGEKPSSSKLMQSDIANFHTLVEKARSISFAGQSERSRLVQSDLIRAKALAAEGKIEDAAVHLSIAVVMQPNVVSLIASDPAYTAILRQPQFNIIAQARFQLPMHTIGVPKGDLSPLAKEVLARLRTLASNHEIKDDQVADVRAIVHSIPNTRPTEHKENTIRTLLQLLDKSPNVLLEQLRDSDKRWILEDNEMLNTLEAEIDRRIQNE